MSSKGFFHAGGPTEEALFDWLAERLRPQAAQWIADHVAGCVRCSEAVRRLRAVHAALEAPELSPFQRQRDLAAVRRRLQRPTRPAPRLAWVSSVVFTALALLVWMGFQRHRGAAPLKTAALRPAPNAAASELGWTILSRSGGAEVELGDRHTSAQPSRVLPATGALSVQPGARVLARWGRARVLVDGGRSGARLRLVKSSADERRIQLERGRILLDVDPLGPGQSLAVATEDALVTVHGTVFLVDATPSGTRVAVTRGLVRVASRNRTIDVSAGHALEPRAAAVASVDPDTRAALEQLSGALPAGGESLEVVSDAPSADGADARRAFLPPAIPPGPQRIRVTANGRIPIEQRVQVGGASALEPLRPKIAAKAAGDPLAHARTQVMAGDYGQAIARLEALRRRGTPTQTARAGLLEAQAYRLSLRPERAVPILESVARSEGPEAEQGELLLAQILQRDLSLPRRAAEIYADAQRRFPQGIFREEVAYRLGEALLSAGKEREGVAALERFLIQFPGAARADDAHLLVAAARRDRLDDCAGALPHLRAVAGDGPLKSPRAELAVIGEARCLQTMRRAQEARAAYVRYLDERPQGRFAAEARQASGSARR